MDRATKNPIVFDGMYRMSKLLKYIQTATSKPTLLMYLFRKHQGGQSLKQLVRKGDQYQAEIYQSPANLQGIKLNLGSLSYVECARKTLVMFACLPWQRDAKDDHNPGMQSQCDAKDDPPTFPAEDALLSSVHNTKRGPPVADVAY
jgi:hypothetical protein